MTTEWEARLERINAASKKRRLRYLKSQIVKYANIGNTAMMNIYVRQLKLEYPPTPEQGNTGDHALASKGTKGETNG